MVVVLTIWVLGTAFLVFPYFGLPAYLHRAGGLLCGLEIVGLLVYSYGSAECDPGGCPVAARLAEEFVVIDVPALAGLLYLLAFGVGLRCLRSRSPDVAVEHREHVLATHRSEAHD